MEGAREGAVADAAATDGSAGRQQRQPLTAGRKKIQMQMIMDNKTRHVTFSKRRKGLFKKASELSILCGAQVGVIAISPVGKPYTFGSPSISHVIDRFRNHTRQQRKGRALPSSECENRWEEEPIEPCGNWWEKEPINEMSFEELQEFYERLTAFRKVAAEKWGVA